MADDTVIRPDAFQSKVMPGEPRESSISPKHVLQTAADEANLRQVIVVGLTEEGRLFAASSHEHIADNLLLVDRFRQRALQGMFGEDRFGNG